MKISKQQLKRIIRRTITESDDIYPRPQHPMYANAGKVMGTERLAVIAEVLMDSTGLTASVVGDVAEEILAQLEAAGLC